jgi:serine/threonine-protein kinase
MGTASRMGGLAKLEEANLAEVARRAERERIVSANQSSTEQRSELVKAASASLKLIENALFDAIADAAPAARSWRPGGRGRTLSLDQAHLEFVPVMKTPSNPWNWEPPVFDVIVQSGIVLSVPTDQYGYQGRSHSLWFCDAREAGRYQWFETAFMMSPLAPRESSMNPFALDPGADAAKALWNGVEAFQLAWPLEPLDIGDMDEFIDRWAGWFGEAAQGHLTQPSRMPERDTPRNWRQK